MKNRYAIGIVLLLAFAGSFAFSIGHKATSYLPPAIISKMIKVIPQFCATFDTTHVLVNPADCNTNNGSVVGLQGTGTGALVYSWYNSLGAKISDQPDLTNVATGTYRVTLADESKCLTASLTYFIKENNPVSIDYNSGTITSPTCNALNGSITGIAVHNATKFEWLDETYKVIAGQTTKDLLNVAPGTYILNARNDKGCLAQGRYIVNGGSNSPTVVSYQIAASDCAASGLFHATFDIKPNELGYQYEIENINTHTNVASGILSYTASDSTRIIIPTPNPIPGKPPGPGLPPGTYSLNTLSAGGCLTKLITFKINEVKLKIDTSQMLIRTNVCGQYTGVILGLRIIGGPEPNPAIRYFWYNDAGKEMSFTGNLISSVPSGWYNVHYEAPDGCISDTLRLFLPDSISAASKPQLNDIKMCLPGTVGLDVLNKDPGAHYKLYDSTMQTVLDTSTAGYFARKVNATTTYYIQGVNGICGSPLGKVTVTVVNPGVSIPNTFTPNNDGINDYWDVTGLDQYPGTEVSVFNRNGQKVYHSINYSSPFNGQYNGKDLPIGNYYYIIDTKKPDCRAGVSGSLTIIR